MHSGSGHKHIDPSFRKMTVLSSVCYACGHISADKIQYDNQFKIRFQIIAYLQIDGFSAKKLTRLQAV